MPGWLVHLYSDLLAVSPHLPAFKAVAVKRKKIR